MNVVPIFHKQAGNVLLSLLVYAGYLFLGLVLFALAYFVFCEARKAYWDHQVKQMCEKDGGVRVYEKEKISHELYKQLGGIQGDLPIPNEKEKSNYPYAREESITKINDQNPEVIRSETVVKRTKDSKALGRFVMYWRRGGDFIAVDHESSFLCPILKTNYSKQIFTIEGVTK